MTDKGHSRARNTSGGGVPCVWMTAGVLTYKLCDRNLDCDRCPLDAALTGDSMPGGRRAAASASLVPWSFPDDRLYSPFHTWTKSLGNQQFSVGIDAFAAHLLQHPRSLQIVPSSALVTSGAVLAIAELDGGSVPIRAPAAMRVLATNDDVVSSPALMITDPYARGWLARIEPRTTPGSELSWQSEHCLHSIFQQQVLNDVQRLRRHVALALLADEDGELFLQDGGEPLSDWPTILGPHRYWSLVLSLLSGPKRRSRSLSEIR